MTKRLRVALPIVLGSAAALLVQVQNFVSTDLLADVALTLMATAVVLFTILYGYRSAWNTNRIGKVFLVKSVLLSLVLVQVAVSVWTNSDYPFRDEIRLLIYASGFVAFVAMIRTLWREQQRDREPIFDHGEDHDLL